MTRADIIRMARDAQATPYTNRHFPDRPFHTFSPEQLERFAALVAAAEREACAVEVEQMVHGNVRTCAAAIRART